MMRHIYSFLLKETGKILNMLILITVRLRVSNETSHFSQLLACFRFVCFVFHVIDTKKSKRHVKL